MKVLLFVSSQLYRVGLIIYQRHSQLHSLALLPLSFLSQMRKTCPSDCLRIVHPNTKARGKFTPPTIKYLTSITSYRRLHNRFARGALFFSYHCSLSLARSQLRSGWPWRFANVSPFSTYTEEIQSGGWLHAQRVSAGSYDSQAL